MSHKYEKDNNIDMFCVRWSTVSDGNQKGMIVLLKDLQMPVHLISCFGKNCPESWSLYCGGELANELYVNPYLDLSTFNSVY